MFRNLKQIFIFFTSTGLKNVHFHFIILDLDEDENNEEWNRLKNSQREIETKYDSLKNL